MNTLPDLLLQTLASRVAFAPDGTTTAGIECLAGGTESLVIGLTDRHTFLERLPEAMEIRRLSRLVAFPPTVFNLIAAESHRVCGKLFQKF